MENTIELHISILYHLYEKGSVSDKMLDNTLHHILGNQDFFYKTLTSN